MAKNVFRTLAIPHRLKERRYIAHNSQQLNRWGSAHRQKADHPDAQRLVGQRKRQQNGFDRGEPLRTVELAEILRIK